MKKTTKGILTTIMAMIMLVCMAVCMAGCSSDSDIPDLEGVGLDQIISVQVPDGFAEDEDSRVARDGKPNGEIIQEFWKNEDTDTEICAEMLVYGGQPIMVKPNTIDEFIEGQKAEEREYNGNTFYIVMGASDADDIANSMAEAYVEHGKYIVRLSMAQTGSPLTKEQMEQFYEMLESAEFSE